jgi:hypothetical protein
MVIGSQVVESSPRLDDYPTPERLMKLGAEHDLVPFVFSRPPLGVDFPLGGETTGYKIPVSK